MLSLLWVLLQCCRVVIQAQRMMRAKLVRSEFLRMRILSKLCSRGIQRSCFFSSIVRCPECVFHCRQQFLAIKIQARFRGNCVREQQRILRCATIAIQRLYRLKLARVAAIKKLNVLKSTRARQFHLQAEAALKQLATTFSSPLVPSPSSQPQQSPAPVTQSGRALINVRWTNLGKQYVRWASRLPNWIAPVCCVPSETEIVQIFIGG